MTEIIKEVLRSLPRFIRGFVNLTGAPRVYAVSGQVFSLERYVDALVFLGISLLVTLISKTPMLSSQLRTVPYLAADAAWKFAFVLAETAIVAFAWRVLRGRGKLGEYFVANCFYFGVLSILGHLTLLIGYAIKRRLVSEIADPLVFWGVYLGLGGALLIWCLACWRTYGDFNRATLNRSALALLIVAALSIPAIAIGVLLRDVLVGGWPV